MGMNSFDRVGGNAMKKPRLYRRAVLCVVLGLAVTVLAGSAVYAVRLMNRMNHVQPEAIAPTMPQLRTLDMKKMRELQLPHLSVPAQPKAGTVSQLQNTEKKDVVNILLIGQDADGGNGVRSDTMILCTFNKRDNTITMTSFLRDLYVKIPGYHKDRINAAYAFGGTPLLNATLQENFSVEVDGNVQVDFSRFQEIIDLLGGVTLELTAAEARFINENVSGSQVQQGVHLLNGEQALMYARDRKDVDGDFSRTNRQRKLLYALVEAYKDQNLSDMLSLIGDILPMITTDISKADMTTYALILFPMLTSAEIKTQSIPVADGFHHARIDGKAVLVPDMEKNRQALAEALT